MTRTTLINAALGAKPNEPAPEAPPAPVNPPTSSEEQLAVFIRTVAQDRELREDEAKHHDTRLRKLERDNQPARLAAVEEASARALTAIQYLREKRNSAGTPPGTPQAERGFGGKFKYWRELRWIALAVVLTFLCVAVCLQHAQLKRLDRNIRTIADFLNKANP